MSAPRPVYTNPGRSRLVGLSLVALTTLILFGLVERIHGIEVQRAREALTVEVLQQLSSMRATLESELGTSLHLASGLVGFVAAYGDRLDPERVDTALRVIHSQSRYIRNVALAPDNVLRYVYPLAGNEAAVGLTYEQNPQQWPAVARAMARAESVLDGPIDLVQGGCGLVNRTPVFLDDGRYWGLLTIVLDCEPLFERLGIEHTGPMAFALRWSADSDRAGEWIAGSDSVVDREPVSLPVDVPGGRWELLAAPAAGWYSGHPLLIWYRLGGHLLVLLIAALMLLLIEERRRIAALALRDPLTGLPNRRQLQRHLGRLIARSERRSARFALVYIDLDGFKAINDRHGHARGDAILQEAAARMAATLAPGDFLARVGGDEFIVILPEAVDADAAKRRLGGLLAAVRQPFGGAGVAGRLDATLGVALYPDDGDDGDGDALVRTADLRMYRAKRWREPLADAVQL